MIKIYTSILFILLSISLGYSQNNPPIIEQEPSLVVLQNIPQNLDMDELNINVTDLDDDNVIVSSSVSQYDCGNISVLTLAQGYGNGASNTLGAGNVQTFKSISTGFITKLAVEFRGSSTSTTQAEIEVYRNNNFDPNSATDVELIGTLTLNIPTGFNVMGEGIFDKPIYLEENRMYAFRKVSGPGILMRQGSFYYPGRTFNHDFDNTLIINESGGTNNDWKFSITQYALSGLSPLTVPVTADDGTDQTTANVEVYHLSEVLPTIITQDISVNLDENGSINITPQQIDSGSTTACGGNLTLTLDVDNFDCTTIGLNTVTLTGEDEFGNSASATAIVTIVDDLAPVLNCNEDIEVTTLSNSQIVNYTLPTFSDNCLGENLEFPALSGGFSLMGTFNNHTYYISDQSFEDIQDHLNTINEIDEGFPVAINSAQENDFITSKIVELGFNNVLLGAIRTSPTDFEWINGEPFIYTNWSDNEPNNSNGVEDKVEILNTGLWNDAGATPLARRIIIEFPFTLTQTEGLASGSEFPRGTTTNTFEVTDSSGNIGSCSFDVDVVKIETPVIITQDIEIALDENGAATVSPEDIDNGSTSYKVEEQYIPIANQYVLSNNMDDFFEEIPAQVITTTEDYTDLTIDLDLATCKQNGLTGAILEIVTVDPATGEPQLENVLGSSSVDSSQIYGWEGCVPGTFGRVSFDFSEINLSGGTYALVLRSSESTGEIAWRRSSIPTDPSNPYNGGNLWTYDSFDSGEWMENSNLDLQFILKTSTLLTTTLDITEFTCDNLGENTVTLTGEDEFGNSASATAIVTVVDNLAPTAIAKDITVVLDANGSANIQASDIDNSSSDNCSIDNLTLDIDTFDCSSLGENLVTFTATDASGNQSSATAVVTVEDNLAPTVVTQDITVELDETGSVSISVEDIDNGSSDNCSLTNLSLNITEFTCDNLGENTVTLTGEDEFGNSASATAIVAVVDNLAPTVVTQDITVVLDANGSANIQASDIDNSSSDNCSIDNLTLDIDTFDCSSLGQNLVTFTATDASGNQSSATAVVTVEDNLAPTVVTQDITVELDETGSVSISVEDIDNGSSDNCSLTNLSLDITEFTCDNLGENTVTLTGEDEFGNSASATAIVAVEDNLAPSLTTQDITLDLAGNASISILPNDVLDQVTDNCTNSENITLSLDVDTFTSTGTYTVSLTGVDEEGNSISMSAQVVVDDTLGTNDVNFNSGLSLYPNPAIDRITIEHQNSPIDQVDVFDINGRLVKASREAQLDVSSLSSGVYIVKVRSNQKHAFIRFIKQ
ncbi:HYR domain-containing protein [Psychroflexus gondwanensis]|uniref:HYR domain-containing protein n=1 Tax=Psychroflexus gondwanensis TaxID=251 RepID=UPI0011BF1B8B|nr:HYR domain-containing protein [Psychroflexus gondwanensis]TXE17777.1 HYR domain-containing protein [Psychroflexus gondwanensis]